MTAHSNTDKNARAKQIGQFASAEGTLEENG